MRTFEQPELSLIFVNYRSAALLGRALRSVTHAGIPDSGNEVIVANNDRDEAGLIETLFSAPGIRIIELGENLGFGAAANAAAKVARGEFLGFLNPDTKLCAGSLDPVVRMFHDRRDVGIVGARLVIDSDGVSTEPWSFGTPLTLCRLLGNKIRPTVGKWDHIDSRPIETGWVSGGALFIRRSLFERISGFDTEFFLYFEDMDLCVRAAEAGYRSVHLASPTFVHSGGASRASDVSRKAYYFASQDRYFAKHRPKWEGVLVRLLRSVYQGL